MRTKSEFQRALQFERWIEIAHSHCQYWRIENGVFQLGVQWYHPETKTEGIDWVDIDSTRTLWIELGY